MKRPYLLLAIVGFALLYCFFLSFLVANGLNVALIVSQLFANGFSTFLAIYVIISAVVLMILVYRESKRVDTGDSWIHIVATLTTSPSFAVPQFLYVRESQMETLASETGSQPGP
jgi:hypothetical protein